LAHRRRLVTGAQLARDGGRGAVGEEDADVDQRGERRASDAETAERAGAELPNDGRVGEQEQRLGDQRAECRDGQAQDLPVVRRGDAGVTRADRRPGGRAVQPAKPAAAELAAPTNGRCSTSSGTPTTLVITSPNAAGSASSQAGLPVTAMHDPGTSASRSDSMSRRRHVAASCSAQMTPHWQLRCGDVRRLSAQGCVAGEAERHLAVAGLR